MNRPYKDLTREQLKELLYQVEAEYHIRLGSALPESKLKQKVRPERA